MIVDIYDKLFRSKTDGCSFDANKKCFDDDQLVYENITIVYQSSSLQF